MDNSFIRFLDNFTDAIDLQNNKLTTFDYDMQIHLKPGEQYSCTSANADGIYMSTNYKAYIVDCSGAILNNITSIVHIELFTDSRSKPQIKLDILSLNVDYYTDLVSLRIDDINPGGKSYWSNPFLNSNYDIEETSRFRFKNYQDLDGTNYVNSRAFQSIRLKCMKKRTTFTSTSQSYTTFQGFKYSGRVIKTKFYEMTFDMCNDFIYDRLQYLLVHDIIYLDNVRVTDKQTFESGEKFSDTNISQLKFKVAVNENDIDTGGNGGGSISDYRKVDYNEYDYKTQ